MLDLIPAPLVHLFASNPFFSGTFSAMVLGAGAVAMRRLPGQAWAFIRKRLTSTVTMRRADTAYFDEIAEFISARRVRSASKTFEIWGRTLTMGMGVSLIRWRGRLIWVERSLETSGMISIERIILTFWAADREVLQDFLDEACGQDQRSRMLDITVRVGMGCSSLRRPKRPFDTVFVNAGVLESVVERIERFRANEDWYLRRGIPYKLCVVFEGPPGTGKTSLIQALAAHFGYSVDFLGQVESIDRVIENNGNRIVVIEDIDTLGNLTRESAPDKRGEPAQTTIEVKAKEASKRSLHDLLQTLDGFLTPHGLVCFMTTNKIHALDPALKRKGRVDEIVHVGPLDIDAMSRMFLAFFPDDKETLDHWRRAWGKDYVPTTGAELQDLFLSNDPRRALAALNVTWQLAEAS